MESTKENYSSPIQNGFLRGWYHNLFIHSPKPETWFLSLIFHFKFTNTLYLHYIPVTLVSSCWYRCPWEQWHMPLAHLNLSNKIHIWLQGIPCLKYCILPLLFILLSIVHKDYQTLVEWIYEWINESINYWSIQGHLWPFPKQQDM